VAEAAGFLLKPPRFTQGLFFAGDLLYESSGLYGQSRLTVWRPAKDELVHEAAACLPERYFAEGAAMARGAISVLTWRENTVLRFAPELTLRDALFVPGQGWGLAWDGERFWRSDGSARLQAHDPETFAPLGPPVEARDGGMVPGSLNELEYDPRTGLVLANLYRTDRVAAIDPETGEVRYILDLSRIAAPLRARIKNPETVLNGLALDRDGRLFATGKMWDRVFEIRYPLPEGIRVRAPPPYEAPPEPAFPASLAEGCPATPE
jgi:glutaminyl-peptide cyclotransferase